MVACSGSRRCRAVVDVPVAASAALALLGDRPTRRNGTVDGLPALERGVGPARMPTMRLGVAGQRCGAAAVRRCGDLRPGRTRRRRWRDARHPRTVSQCPPAAGGALVLHASRRCRCDPRGGRLSGLIPRRPRGERIDSKIRRRHFRVVPAATGRRHSILKSATRLQEPETWSKNAFSGLKLDRKIAHDDFSTVRRVLWTHRSESTEKCVNGPPAASRRPL